MINRTLGTLLPSSLVRVSSKLTAAFHWIIDDRPHHRYHQYPSMHRTITNATYTNPSSKKPVEAIRLNDYSLPTNISASGGNSVRVSDGSWQLLLNQVIRPSLLNPSSLSLRRRGLLMVSALTATSQWHYLRLLLPLLLNGFHLDGVHVDRSISEADVRESLYHLIAYIGFPKALNACDIINDYNKANNITPIVTHDTEPMRSTTQIPDSMTQLYGEHYANTVYRYLSNADGALGHAAIDYYTRVWSRSILSVQERSLITCAALIAINEPPKARIHITGFLNSGASVKELEAAFDHLIPFCGFPNVCEALQIMEAALKDQKK